MASQEEDSSKCYSFIIIECMMEPLKKRLKSPEFLNEGQIVDDVQSIEAITHMIMVGSQTSSVGRQRSENEWDEVIVSFVKEVCLPILSSLHVFPNSSKKNLEKATRSIAVQSISSCIGFIKEKSMACNLVFEMLLPLCSLNTENKVFFEKAENWLLKCHSSLGNLDTISSLEIFSALLSEHAGIHIFLSNASLFDFSGDIILKHLFHSALIASEIDKNCFSKSLNIISKLLSLCPAPVQTDLISVLWQKFSEPKQELEGNLNKETLWQSLFAFYFLKDFLFPLEKSKSAVLVHHLGDEFWALIQEGLVSIEPSHRKLSIYLLKRLVDTCHQNGCTANIIETDDDLVKGESRNAETKGTLLPLFWWHDKQSASLSEVWEDFILLIETLEEKQITVIFLKYELIYFGMFHLHSSWLITIFIRCFQHESQFVSRWGSLTLLTADFLQVPFIKHGQMKFLSQDLLEYLQDNRLYSRYNNDTEVGNKASPVGEALTQFFAKLFLSMSHNERAEYLKNVLEKMLARSWSTIPMVYLTKGLSNIPPQPILRNDDILLIRDILRSCLSPHDVQTKGAIQCFFAQMIMNLADLDSVSLLEFFMTMSVLSRDEALKRGTNLWKNLSEYLQNEKVTCRWNEKQILSIASDFLKEAKSQVEGNTVVYDGMKVTGITRMLLLFMDADFRTFPKEKTKMAAIESCPLGTFVNEIQLVITNIRSRSYINICHVDTCLAVMRCLGKDIGDIASNDHIGMFIKTKLGQTFPPAVSFVIRRLSENLIKLQDLEEIHFYCDVISTLGTMSPNPLPPLQELLTFVSNAFNLTTQQMAKTGESAGVGMLSTSAMRVLHKVLEIVQKNIMHEGCKDTFRAKILEMKSIHAVPLPFSSGAVNRDVGNSKAQIGYIISSFLSSKWHCQRLITLLGYEWNGSAFDLRFLVESSMETMTLGSGVSDIAVFGALDMIMKQVVAHLPLLVPSLLDLGWRKIIEEKKSILFWQKFEALVPVALHNSVLEPQVDEDVKAAVDEFIDRVFTLGQEKCFLIYLVVKHVCDSCLTLDDGRKKAERMMPLLVQACDFGTIHKKWLRLWLDTVNYIEGHGPMLASNQILNSIAKNEMSVRIVIINWLSDLKLTVEADHRFVMMFLRSLYDKYLAEAKMLRHFMNSLSHRQKHRMVMVILFLSDFIKQGDCDEFLSKLKDGLELECHGSVAHNLEWMMMRLFIRYPMFLPRLWGMFSEFVKRRSMCLCSLFLVMIHIGPKLPKDIQVDFYNKAFPIVLPWTMAHHYSTRIFAQGSLTCLWQQCTDLNLTQVLEKFSLIQPTMEFLQNNSGASKTVEKLLDNFILSGFDPVRDFSAETIFYTLPRLASISDDEWISPQQILKQYMRWNEVEKCVPFFNSSPEFSKCKEGLWKTKGQVEYEDDVTKKMHGDVQKKIMPWRQMSPSEDMENELVAIERRPGSKDGLVLVTSLIDKLPNLGGLCRTSEIFGVSEFVIGNLLYLEDKGFQTLSVSAHKWLSITEVLPPKLPDYLAEKRRQGYTLVGVEQTANSVPLDEYAFPQKSLLMLGNEKEGIPPDMIQTLDVCVEIPQRGVIRSLNVHVCGALIVWEYMRQHMKSQEKKDGQA